MTTLSSLISDAIDKAKKPDVELILARVLRDVTQEMREDIVEPFIRGAIGDAVRERRRQQMSKARVEANRSLTESRIEAHRNDTKNSVARRITQERKCQADDFFNVWKNTATGRKFLGDCSVKDLLFSRDQNMKMATECADAAERDDLLAIHLSDSKCDTLREMGYEQAIQAFRSRPQLLSEVA